MTNETPLDPAPRVPDSFGFLGTEVDAAAEANRAVLAHHHAQRVLSESRLAAVGAAKLLETFLATAFLPLRPDGKLEAEDVPLVLGLFDDAIDWIARAHQLYTSLQTNRPVEFAPPAETDPGPAPPTPSAGSGSSPPSSSA